MEIWETSFESTSLSHNSCVNAHTINICVGITQGSCTAEHCVHSRAVHSWRLLPVVSWAVLFLCLVSLSLPHRSKRWDEWNISFHEYFLGSSPDCDCRRNCLWLLEQAWFFLINSSYSRLCHAASSQHAVEKWYKLIHSPTGNTAYAMHWTHTPVRKDNFS